MGRYWTKPVIVEAAQYTADFTPDGVCFCKAKRAPAKGEPIPHVHQGRAKDFAVVIRHTDWVVMTEKDGFTILPDRIFSRDYEPMPE